MKISIIIPSYKPQFYLYDCLKSIKEQKMPEEQYEVLIILNGCKNPYLKNIEKLKKELFADSENIRIFQTDNSGVSNARNIGINNAKGEYITFIDDDDVISPTYIEELVKVSTPTCVGCANSFSFHTDIGEHLPNFLSNAYERCLNLSFDLYNYRQFLSPPVCKMIHREIIGKNRFPTNLKKSEDSVFCLKISPQIKDMKLASNDCIYYIRNRYSSATRKRNNMKDLTTEHLSIMWEYIKVWLSNPFRYNLKFFLSRLAACARNYITYCGLVQRKKLTSSSS